MPAAGSRVFLKCFVQARRLRGSDSIDIADHVDEAPHLLWILVARTRLDAAGDIDRVRPDDADRLGDVFRRQTAGQDEQHVPAADYGQYRRAAPERGRRRV